MMEPKTRRRGAGITMKEMREARGEMERKEVRIERIVAWGVVC